MCPLCVGGAGGNCQQSRLGPRPPAALCLFPTGKNLGRRISSLLLSQTPRASLHTWASASGQSGTPYLISRGQLTSRPSTLSSRHRGRQRSIRNVAEVSVRQFPVWVHHSIGGLRHQRGCPPLCQDCWQLLPASSASATFLACLGSRRPLDSWPRDSAGLLFVSFKLLGLCQYLGTKADAHGPFAECRSWESMSCGLRLSRDPGLEGEGAS